MLELRRTGKQQGTKKGPETRKKTTQRKKTMTENEIKNRNICRKFVDKNVIHNISTLIQHLAHRGGFALKGSQYNYEDILSLLVSYNYEQPCRDVGWIHFEEWGSKLLGSHAEGIFLLIGDDEKIEEDSQTDTWKELANEKGIEPHRLAAQAHWIVSERLASELQKQGESVGDVFDLMVWGRKTRGQAILQDSVIKRIAFGLEILAGQKYEWSV